MSDSVRPHRWQPTRLPRPWDSPGKNTIHTTIYKIGNNKDLLYSMGSSTQYSVIIYMAKESEKECIYVYVKLNHFTIHLKLTRHCKIYSNKLKKKHNRQIANKHMKRCSTPTLCNPMDCSLPGSSVHGILQARILEWVAISFSRGSS